MDNRDIRKLVYSSWQAARKAIASPWIRKYRSVIFQVYVIIALIAFSALALMANIIPYFQVDLLFTREIQTISPHWFGFVLQMVSVPGYATPSIIVIAVTVILLGIFGLRWEALSALFTAFSSGTLNYLVKIVIRRPRPTADLVTVFDTLNSYSFPSGHTMFYTAFFGFLLFLSFILLKRSWIRTIILILLAGIIILVGPSRMYLGEHWASDVLGGYLLGSLTLMLAIQFYHWGKQRFIVEQPVAPSDGAEPSIASAIPVTAKKTDTDEHSSTGPGKEQPPK